MQWGNVGEPLQGHPRWETVRTIGRGSQSIVQLARDKLTGELVAIKFVQRGGLMIGALKRSIIASVQTDDP